MIDDKSVIRVLTLQLGTLIQEVGDLAREGHGTDGGHHKQWYLEQILEAIGEPLDDYRLDGIIP